jgi:hypothetical protein
VASNAEEFDPLPLLARLTGADIDFVVAMSERPFGEPRLRCRSQLDVKTIENGSHL